MLPVGLTEQQCFQPVADLSMCHGSITKRCSKQFPAQRRSIAKTVKSGDKAKQRRRIPSRPVVPGDPGGPASPFRPGDPGLDVPPTSPLAPGVPGLPRAPLSPG